jgi:hypothetical protein
VIEPEPRQAAQAAFWPGFAAVWDTEPRRGVQQPLIGQCQRIVALLGLRNLQLGDQPLFPRGVEGDRFPDDLVQDMVAVDHDPAPGRVQSLERAAGHDLADHSAMVDDLRLRLVWHHDQFDLPFRKRHFQLGRAPELDL